MIGFIFLCCDLQAKKQSNSDSHINHICFVQISYRSQAFPVSTRNRKYSFKAMQTQTVYAFVPTFSPPLRYNIKCSYSNRLSVEIHGFSMFCLSMMQMQDTFWVNVLYIIFSEHQSRSIFYHVELLHLMTDFPIASCYAWHIVTIFGKIRMLLDNIWRRPVIIVCFEKECSKCMQSGLSNSYFY